MDDALNSEDPRMQGLRASTVPVDRAIRMEFAGEEPVLFQTVSPRTPSGKIELESAMSGRATERPCRPTGRWAPRLSVHPDHPRPPTCA